MEVVSMRAHLMAMLCAMGCGGTPAPKDVPAPVDPAGAGTAAPVDPATDPTAVAPATPASAAGAAMGLARPTVPAELAVPDGHKPTVMTMAKGVQIYACVADKGAAPAWKLHAPRADLLDDTGAVIGSHYGGVDKKLPVGPYWEAKDGSRVHGAKPVTVPSAGSIPLVRLEAADTSGTGVFAKVSYIHRLDTTGGVAPAGACTVGKTTEVAYTAKYYFYTAP
jgi:hypothetical protein